MFQTLGKEAAVPYLSSHLEGIKLVFTLPGSIALSFSSHEKIRKSAKSTLCIPQKNRDGLNVSPRLLLHETLLRCLMSLPAIPAVRLKRYWIGCNVCSVTSVEAPTIHRVSPGVTKTYSASLYVPATSWEL
jgi:hypothetical protein